MTSDALMVVRTLFSSIWSFFISWYIPGTRVTPATAAFFLLMACVIIRIIRAVFRVSPDNDDK
jgi:hypothetical protein